MIFALALMMSRDERVACLREAGQVLCEVGRLQLASIPVFF